MRRKYLAVFLLQTAQKEHAQIVEAVRHHSGGDFKIAFTHGTIKGPSTVGYVFTSETVPWEMGFGLLNGDRSLVVELGDLYSDHGLNVPAAWLRAHQDRK